MGGVRDAREQRGGVLVGAGVDRGGGEAAELDLGRVLGFSELGDAPADEVGFDPAVAAECDAVRDLRGFFTVWTRKEAFIKALGDALQRPLDSFTVTLDGPAALLDVSGWTLRDVPGPPGYLAALAVEGEAASVRVLPWSPSQGVTRGHQPRTARR